MDESLDKEIDRVATRVRRTDFLWAVGLSFGACAILGGFADTPIPSVLLVWGVFLLGLAFRYFSSNVDWSVPVRRVVTTQLGVYERLRGVMNALPEPVVLLSEDGTVEMANPATTEFVGTEAEGKYLTTLLRSPAISHAMTDARNSGQAQVTDILLSGRVERHCRVYVTPLPTLPGEGIDMSLLQGRMLVLISDLTSERRLDQMRSDFIANASHELRTPLASMIGFIETLRGHAKDDAEAREKFLGIMNDQAQRMLRLVKELMSLSSIELNEHMPPQDRVNIVQVVEDVKDSLAPVANEYRGSITTEVLLDKADEFVTGDRDELIQVIQNLADNAVKYSGQEPKVTLHVGTGVAPDIAPNVTKAGEAPGQISARAGIPLEQLIYVQVRDHGPGINRNDLPRLTERFYRADVEESRSRGGTGLGLAIVKHIINRHGGSMQIETTDGGGSAFTCYLRPFRT